MTSKIAERYAARNDGSNISSVINILILGYFSFISYCKKKGAAGDALQKEKIGRNGFPFHMTVKPNQPSSVSSEDPQIRNASQTRPLVNPWAGSPTEPMSTTTHNPLRPDLASSNGIHHDGTPALAQNGTGSHPTQLSMRSTNGYHVTLRNQGRLGTDLDDVEVDAGFQVRFRFRASN